MHELPTSWKLEPLGSVATLQRGFDLPVQSRRSGGYPVFAANGQIGVHDEAMVKGPGVVTGRSGSIGKVHFVHQDYWPLNTALWVRDFHGNNQEWVRYLLEWFDLSRFARGAAVPTLDRKLVHSEPVPVPPVDEQRRIVTRIKACMERIDEIEGLRSQTRKEASILELASFHDVLLDGIEQKGWPVGKLGDVALSFKYGTSAKAHSDEVGTPVLRMGNIANGYFDFSALKFIELLASELNKYRLKVGDILINRTNSLELVGKAAMFDREDGEWVYASYLVCVEVDRTRVLPEFVTAVLNSRMGRDFVAATARRAIGMVNIYAKEMARFPMPLPSLKDQEVAVERLRAVRASAQSLRAELSEPGVAHMRSSVLRKAFAGDL